MVVLPTILALFMSTALATPAKRDFVVQSSRASAPAGFVATGAAPSSSKLNFRVGLASKNVSGLESMLYAVSLPSSPLYGQHLSVDELKDFLSPTVETTTAVTEWLSSNGLNADSIVATGHWVSLTTTVEQANTLFDADFQVFTHTATGNKLTRTLSYSLPSDIVGHVDVVHPATSFDVQFKAGPFKATPINLNKTARAAPSSCASDFTPDCVLEEYGIPSTPATERSNTLAVTAYEDEFAEFSDLTLFLEVLRPDAPAASFSVVSIDGGINPQGSGEAGLEASLDIQYTVGIATGVPVTFYTVGGVETIAQFATALIDTAASLISNDSRPQVYSTSYGTDESAVATNVFTKLCTDFAALGTLGVSVVFASGDGGVAGGHGESCTVFPPAWPVGCPFITTVGATQDIPETAADFSSGGFSNVFAQPSYQADAVASYLEFLGTTNAGLFNVSGRAYPDVSAIGVDIEVVAGGEGFLVDGTSCSSPIFASVIALINDKLAAAGSPPLGFLNPFLYANPSAFFDITTGDNPGCNTNGFSATTGWDPVTGLGTPNFAALLAAAGV